MRPEAGRFVFETVWVANTSWSEGTRELLRGRGTQWDPEVVDAFAETLPGAVPAEARTRWTEVRSFAR